LRLTLLPTLLIPLLFALAGAEAVPFRSLGNAIQIGLNNRLFLWGTEPAKLVFGAVDPDPNAS
jgi:hypothetical protein